MYVNFTLIFFRSKTIESSLDIMQSMIGLNGLNFYMVLDKGLFLIFIFLLAIIISFCFKNSNYLVENYNKIIK